MAKLDKLSIKNGGRREGKERTQSEKRKYEQTEKLEDKNEDEMGYNFLLFQSSQTSSFPFVSVSLYTSEHSSSLQTPKLIPRLRAKAPIQYLLFVLALLQNPEN